MIKVLNAEAVGFLTLLLQSIGWAMLHICWIGLLIGMLFGLARVAAAERILLRYWSGLAALLALPITVVLLVVREWSAATNTAVFASAGTEVTVTTGSYLNAMQLLTLPIALVWAVGVLVLALRLAAGFRGLNRVSLRACIAPELDPIVQHWRKMLGVSERVIIKISDEILVPCVFGMAKPMVLLPAALLLKIDRTQLELVILHELVHVKRWDAWLNALQLTIETALFFHPTVHWISGHVRNDRELLCDQEVLKASAQPLAYARALLNLEEYRQTPQNLAIAFNSGQFSDRVKRILTNSQGTHTRLEAKRSVGAVMLSTCMVLLGAALGLTLLTLNSGAPIAQRIAFSSAAPMARTPIEPVQWPPLNMTLPAISAPFAAVLTRGERLPELQLLQSPVAKNANELIAIINSSPTIDAAMIAKPMRLSMNSDRRKIVPSQRAQIPFQRRRVEIHAPMGACLLRTGTRICRVAQG